MIPRIRMTCLLSRGRMGARRPVVAQHVICITIFLASLFALGDSKKKRRNLDDLLPRPLSKEQIKTFKRDGVLVFENAISEREVEEALSGLHS